MFPEFRRINKVPTWIFFSRRMDAAKRNMHESPENKGRNASSPSEKFLKNFLAPPLALKYELCYYTPCFQAPKGFRTDMFGA